MERSEWEQLHPNYCVACGGRGYFDIQGSYYEDHNVDMCGACIEAGKCPWCGGALEVDGCPGCGWTDQLADPPALYEDPEPPDPEDWADGRDLRDDLLSDEDWWAFLDGSPDN